MSDFSQADSRVVQVPPAFEVVAGELSRTAAALRRYTDMRVSPGNAVERFGSIDRPAAGNLLIEEGVGFPIHSIMIDNPTYRWLLLEPGRRVVQPYCVGMIHPVYQGGQILRVTVVAPPGLADHAVVAGQTVWVVASEAYLNPSPGIVIAGAPA